MGQSKVDHGKRRQHVPALGRGNWKTNRPVAISHVRANGRLLVQRSPDVLWNRPAGIERMFVDGIRSARSKSIEHWRAVPEHSDQQIESYERSLVPFGRFHRYRYELSCFFWGEGYTVGSAIGGVRLSVSLAARVPLVRLLLLTFLHFQDTKTEKFVNSISERRVSSRSTSSTSTSA